MFLDTYYSWHVFLAFILICIILHKLKIFYKIARFTFGLINIPWMNMFPLNKSAKCEASSSIVEIFWTGFVVAFKEKGNSSATLNLSMCYFCRKSGLSNDLNGVCSDNSLFLDQNTVLGCIFWCHSDSFWSQFMGNSCLCCGGLAKREEQFLHCMKTELSFICMWL